MKTNITTFQLDKAESIQKILAEFPHHTSKSYLGEIEFLDSFDWRLYHKNYSLYKSENSYEIHNILSKNIEISTWNQQNAAFTSDFSDLQFQSFLSPILGIRALICFLKLDYETYSYNILDDNEKTVLRLKWEMFTSANKDFSSIFYLSLFPLRGYEETYNAFHKFLKQMDIAQKRKSPFLTILHDCKAKPGNYSSKFQLSLSTDMSAKQAMQLILANLLTTVNINIPCIIQDIDSEFLHDFRVAIRRARSALSQIKNVFSEQQTLELKAKLADLSRLSNELRDLDVYLLKESSYQNLLPLSLKNSILPLFRYLKEKREKALLSFNSSIQSDTYQQILQAWKRSIEEPTDPGKNAGMAILTLAKQRIYSKYKRVIRDGMVILENQEDQLLHDLRIECKKLRYLLEFFHSLFSQSKSSYLIKQLKKLQNNLGDFNDLDVQKTYLETIANDLPANSIEEKNTLLAIGALLGALEERQMTVKNKFAQTFTEFAAKPNKGLFQELYSSKKSASTKKSKA
ncbi:MAG: CHAD domain-containing protein [Spirochaetota bacterium]